MIRIDGVTKRFGRARVLDDLTLEIATRDRVALIGSNGAGKTTLIRCLLGEYVHDGQIAIDGLSPRRHRRAVLRRIGFVPQLPPPLKMPVRELIRFAARTCAAEPAAITTIAVQLGLDPDDIYRRPFHKLSGGQKQKILVAIALGRQVDFLILDEPTANLDPAARRVLFELLAARMHLPMIVSSHRLDEIAGLVNRVIEMDRGQVVLDDRVEETVDASVVQACRLEVAHPDAAFERAIGEWGFDGSADRLIWRGSVAGPDRLRFFGMLARYSGLLTAVAMSGEVEAPTANGAPTADGAAAARKAGR